MEFPVVSVEFYIPRWTEMLPSDHKVKQGLIQEAIEWMTRVNRMRDLYGETSDGASLERDGKIEGYQEAISKDAQQDKHLCNISIRRIHTEKGTAELRMDVDETHYFDFLSDLTGMPITGEYQMISMIKDLSEKKKAYEKVENALSSVTGIGYGVVAPELNDITMEEPVLIAHGGKFGVKIRANSPSIHMIKANIETEIAPIVGSKEQAEDLITYIKDGEFSEDGIWSANIFGKSLGELMEDGIRHKIEKMDDECQQHLQNTMQKIVNENNGGMVFIII
jgi:stage IV sporulation protein A